MLQPAQWKKQGGKCSSSTYVKLIVLRFFSINKNNFQYQIHISYLLPNFSVIYLNSQICDALLIQILSLPQHNRYCQDSFVKRPGVTCGWLISRLLYTEIQEKKYLIEIGKYLVKSFGNFNSPEENSNYGRLGV